MLNVLTCIVYEHDLRLVALSALICVLGCYTTVTVLSRAHKAAPAHAFRWIAGAALVFGSSVWSLHFVAMLAFMPDREVAYDLKLTALSIAVACGGTLAGLLAGRLPLPAAARILLGGVLLGMTIVGMHYIGVAAITLPGFLLLDADYVAASVVISIG